MQLKVVYSGKVREALKELLAAAARQDPAFAAAALASVRAIDERLQTGAREFGEPRYRLPASDLEIRFAVIRPVAVAFAVHATKPLVFVSQHYLLTMSDS